MMSMHRLPNFGGRLCTVRGAAVTFYSRVGGGRKRRFRASEKIRLTSGRHFPVMGENIRVSTQPFWLCGSMMACQARPKYGSRALTRRGAAGTLHPVGGFGMGLTSAPTAVALRQQHPRFGPQTGDTTALGQSRAVHTCGWFACRIWGSSATAQAECAPKCLIQEPSEGRFPIPLALVSSMAAGGGASGRSRAN